MGEARSLQQPLKPKPKGDNLFPIMPMCERQTKFMATIQQTFGLKIPKRFLLACLHRIFIMHGVWKSQKKSHSTLRAKRATFTFWMDKNRLKMPKMVHFGEFLKTWSLRSNSVTRQVSFNRRKIGGKWKIQMRHFWWFWNNVWRAARTQTPRENDLDADFEKPLFTTSISILKLKPTLQVLNSRGM